MGKGYVNLFSEFIEQQRREFGRTIGFWSERWKVPESTIARWAKGDRRIGPNNRHIFDDLPFTMDEYYRSMPPSDQTQQRSDVRRYGRTQAARSAIRKRMAAKRLVVAGAAAVEK